MNKQASVRNIIIAAVVSVVSIISANAQQTPSGISNEASVTFIGRNESQLAFNIRYENSNAEKFQLAVYDAGGNLLFSENYTDKKFSKVFKAPSEIGKLTFVITNLKAKTELKFEANTERRFVEEVSVTKA